MPMGGGGEARGCASAGVRVGWGTVKITIGFGQKHLPTCSFYGSPPPPTSLGPDRWVRHEGYGGPDPGEKSFQLFSIFIV